MIDYRLQIALVLVLVGIATVAWIRELRRRHVVATGRLQAERDYLLARAAGANHVDFREGPRWTGTSSNALVRYAFGGAIPMSSEYPMDISDLAACYRAVSRLPDHLKEPESRALQTVRLYRRAVQARYDLTEMDARLAKEGLQNAYQ